MSNPFSFATLRLPSHGGAVTLGKTDISPVVMPPENFLIGDVALILAPKFPATERETLAAILNSSPRCSAPNISEWQNRRIGPFTGGRTDH
jgi:hypothetical protein